MLYDEIFVSNLNFAVYRTNTYPLIHAGFFHMLWNLVAVTPLLASFESEHGTLTSAALFFGRKVSHKAHCRTGADASQLCP